MKKSRLLGRISYFLLWPGIGIYLLGSRRTRVLVIHGNKILVVKDWLGDGKWSLPGGGLHSNESVEAGCIRELFEETSIQVYEKEIGFMKSEDFWRNGVKMKLYYCLLTLSELKKTKIQKDEITDIDWIDPINLNIKNAHKDLLRALAIWKAR